MSNRYAKIKDYLLVYKNKTNERKLKFFQSFKEQRKKIIERERKKLLKWVTWSCILLGVGYTIYEEIYSKSVEVGKMSRKLSNFYSSIAKYEQIDDENTAVILKPTTIDQLTNLISLCYRYHYRVIAGANQTVKEKRRIITACNSKCLFFDLELLNQIQINSINSTIYAQTGTTCFQINQVLQANGYHPIFHTEFDSETLYDAITNNLPLLYSTLNKEIINFELISASGSNFRSSSQLCQYGQIPSLNSLFLGTGGAFAFPTAIIMKIQPKHQTFWSGSEQLQININDVSLKVDALRKLEKEDLRLVQIQLQNHINLHHQNHIYINCLPRFNIKLENICSNALLRNNIPFIHQTVSKSSQQSINYNAFFNVNHEIFQHFLIKFGNLNFPYCYSAGLLRIHMEDEDQLSKMINEITNNNGVFVWCKDKNLLLKCKPSVDSSEVGAELMKKLVEVREGLDRRKVFYSHNRYEQYFAKGFFRRITEFFW